MAKLRDFNPFVIARRVVQYPYWLVVAPAPEASLGDQAYSKYVKDRRIALVGPAPSTAGTHQGERIDSFDRVVRLNHALPIPEDQKVDIGARTDILYHNLWRGSKKDPPSERLIQELLKGVTWICGAYPYIKQMKADIDAFVPLLDGRLPFRTVSIRPHVLVRLKTRTLPNAGVSAIVDLLQFDIQELYVTGFTFFTGSRPYLGDYPGRGAGGHSHPPQIAFVRNLLRKEPRLRVDDTVREILSGAPHNPRS